MVVEGVELGQGAPLCQRKPAVFGHSGVFIGR